MSKYSLRCPRCGETDTGTLETRRKKDGSIRRRKICEFCYYRFNSVERVFEEIKPRIILID